MALESNSFLVITITDGGAEEALMSADDVQTMLDSESYPSWNEAAERFYSHSPWMPGEFMDYPCGWIIRVINTPVK